MDPIIMGVRLYIQVDSFFSFGEAISRKSLATIMHQCGSVRVSERLNEANKKSPVLEMLNQALAIVE